MLTRTFLTALASALLAIAVASGCEGAVERPAMNGDANPPAEAEGGAGDAGSDVVGPCVLAGEECSNGGGSCCPPAGAFRVDLTRNCKATSRTPLYCLAAPKTATTKCAGFPDEQSCLWREADGGAGMDAGIEVYVSNYYVDAPGFAHCDGALGTAAYAAVDCP
jgi:hypothetical protein